MSAKDQIKQIVDFFKREPYLKDKTDGMAEGLMLGARLADEANELSKEVQSQVDQLVISGDSSVEAAQARVDASGNSFATLKKRLDNKEQETIGQLAQKAGINYVDSILMDIAKGGPRGPFYSIASLEAEYPNGADATWLVFDNSFDDGAHTFIWDSFNHFWKDLGLYQGYEVSDGTVTTNKLADSSVTPEKNTYWNVRRNLYNSSASSPGYYVYHPNGGLEANSNYRVTDYIRINPNDVLRVTEDYSYALYTENNQYISGKDGGWGNDQPLDEQNKLVIPNSPSIRKLRMTAPLNDANFMILTGGEKPTEFIPQNSYKITRVDSEITVMLEEEKNKDKGIKMSSLEAMERKVINLADPNHVVVGRYPLPANGALSPITGYDAQPNVPVEAGKRYMLSQNNNYAFYDGTGKFISGANGGWDITEGLVAPPNAGLLTATWRGTNSNRMIVEGTKLPPFFVDYNSTLNLQVNYINEAWQVRMRRALSRLNGKTWNALGDSLTFGAKADDYPYTRWIHERTGIDVANYGISMSSITDMVDNPQGNNPADYNPMVFRYTEMRDDVNFVTILAGTNDIQHGAPIGQYGDTGTHTIYGALDTLLSGILKKYPKASIAYILPPFTRPLNDTDGRKEAGIEAIRLMCKKYTIPVLDLFTTNGGAAEVPERIAIMAPDGTHFSEFGQEKISYPIEDLLNRV